MKNKKNILMAIVLLFALVGLVSIARLCEPAKDSPIPIGADVKCYKPVIYLYPKAKTDLEVSLTLKNGSFTCTYPEISGNTWNVSADTDGTITDKNGQKYSYLFWEGDVTADWDFSVGTCVPGSNTARFLEKSLSALGLNRKEANDFITFWLPVMKDNPYNVISFQTEVYENAAKLKITPEPDSMLRVFMTWYPSDTEVKIEPQTVTKFKRTGFSVVEWGGAKIQSPIETNAETVLPVAEVAPSVPPVLPKYPSWVVGINGVDDNGAHVAYDYLKAKGLPDSSIQSNWGALMYHYAGHGTSGW